MDCFPLKFMQCFSLSNLSQSSKDAHASYIFFSGAKHSESYSLRVLSAPFHFKQEKMHHGATASFFLRSLIGFKRQMPFFVELPSIKPLTSCNKCIQKSIKES